MQSRFSNKVCLVTGGGSGIGLAACRRFAAEGGQVVVADLNEQHGRDAVAALAKAGAEENNVLFARCDVSKSADVRAAVDAAVSRFGRIDVLVNNAAMMTFKPVVDLSEDDWNHVLAVNLTSVFLFCKYAAPHVPPTGGAIVNTSSVHAHETEPTVAPYVASKGGMEALARCLALELAPRKIRVNCVAPGAVDTPMLWNNPRVKSGKEKVTGAVGQPDDIAAAICFLASDEAKFINGTTLIADGARLDIL
jgi:NAD(P)-dependent dehydrogenase (short-subunit alcohol dehydrogenase family)